MSKSRLMTKPDRLVTLVEKHNRAPFSDEPWVYSSDVLALLRREQRAHRARVRRIVKQQTRWKFVTFDHTGKLSACMTTEPDGEYLDRDQLLKALHGRTP